MLDVILFFIFVDKRQTLRWYIIIKHAFVQTFLINFYRERCKQISKINTKRKSRTETLACKLDTGSVDSSLPASVSSALQEMRIAFRLHQTDARSTEAAGLPFARDISWLPLEWNLIEIVEARLHAMRLSALETERRGRRDCRRNCQQN